MMAPPGADDHGDPLVTVRDLWVGYRRDVILEGIDLVIRDRDFVGLLGPNGGGKTTLLRVLMGLLRPWRGEVRMLGRPVAEVRHRIGYVPQAPEFDRDFPVTVREVVRMGRLRRGRPGFRLGADDCRAVDEALDRVGMSSAARRRIGDLSGGQRQRVYIARALAAGPALLLLDEPMSSVDPAIRTGLYDLLRDLNERAAIVMVTHDLGAVSAHVKTIGCLNRRLHYHQERELTPEMLEAAYQCPVELIAHGVPHRVLAAHGGGGVTRDD